MLRIQGTGVTPFNTTKQATLVVSIGSVMTTVTQDEIGVILVSSVYSSRRRSLLSADDAEVQLSRNHAEAMQSAAHLHRLCSSNVCCLQAVSHHSAANLRLLATYMSSLVVDMPDNLATQAVIRQYLRSH